MKRTTDELFQERSLESHMDAGGQYLKSSLHSDWAGGAVGGASQSEGDLQVPSVSVWTL